MYKVLISCAGLGSRVEQHSYGFNKSLISIDKKAVITHIIENIENEVPIVICLGYKSETLKQYLDVAHNDRDISYVYVDDYQSENSGLSYSISKASHLLQCPFVFISNDSILKTKIVEPTENYVFYSKKLDNTVEIKNYRTVSISPFKINEKKENDINAYVGVCGILEYEKFWRYNQESIDMRLQCIGETYSLNKLKCSSYMCEWFDTGNQDQLKITSQAFSEHSDIHILDKAEECIWFTNDRVVKFHKDTNFIKQRVNRTLELKKFVPSIINNTLNFFSYSKFEGEVMSSITNIECVERLFKYLNDFWEPVEVDRVEFKEECMKFYKDKTYNRVKEYIKANKYKDTVLKINDVTCEPILEKLDGIDWDWISNGVPVRFHGDLHFENILHNENTFMLIDWRQNFGKFMNCGDIYYDLAKLKHGLIVSHNMVNKEMYSVSESKISISEEWYKKESMDLIDSYIIENCYDKNKVDVLTYLIFLNVAVLHHKPYDKFLFMLGNLLLNGGDV